MGSQLKISADTSEVKKSILDLSRNLKNIGSTKVAVFTESDKKFLKTELKKELGLMKSRLKENREEIKKMVEDQKKLVSGSREELEARKKILEAYKIQNKLAKEAGEIQKISKDGIKGGGGGGLGDKLMNMLGSIPKLLGGAALAVGGFGIMKGIQASDQYVGGASNRVKLKGLGNNQDNFGSSGQMARAGVTEQDLIRRTIETTAVLGRAGTSSDNELKKASFERAYGLNAGAMSNVSTSLRGSFGGQGANEAQSKLQATILASGIEDAIGPYLETMTSLLGSINENGTTNTADLMNVMAQMTKDGGRTPEQMAKQFGTINSAIQGATGESSAFLQTAFSKAGIGGGTIGGTKYAMESGGLFGLNRDELSKRGYNSDLLNNMGQGGMFQGIGGRSDAIMNQFKSSAGMKPGQSISGITDMNQMVGMNNLSNSVFGTKGNQGFDALMMLEKVQNKQMSPKEFDEKVKKMQESKDPVAERLDTINKTLAGQTDILGNINTNLMESLGKNTVGVRNELKGLENSGIEGTNNVAGAVNGTGIVQGVGGSINSGAKDLVSGGVGSNLYDWYDAAKGAAFGKNSAGGANSPSAKEIGSAVADALKNSPIVSTIKNMSIKLPAAASDRTRK